MYESLRKIVENIFNNWTALQLAVEHHMGGSNSKELALSAIEDLTKYCIDYQVEITDIEDQLEDLMDLQFNTTCEDGSIKEISNLLYRFLQLLQENNMEQVEIEYNKLPKNDKLWLTQPVAQSERRTHQENVEEMTVDETPVDSEWTEVKSRRKK
ncbi:pre-rRNA-processing protein TSR2 homolog [Onthophagus taurus]|uniref:pre-rRNA-processing protein TSR2 homolog n=1 Tax=Onthophagus taurus TaxID=166361 RepID=UPI000C2041AE|nr:uncharacterized protein LOC111415964 [Onthophagus taurus]